VASLRVLVVDDHPLFRFGLCSVLADRTDIEVIGEVAGGEAAISAARALKPDVIVMDLHLPDLPGVEATRVITAADDKVGVLVLTMFDDNESVFAAMRAGARGYLVKGSETSEVVAAITAIGRGEAIFGPPVAQRILSFLTKPLSAFDDQIFPGLSRREREILDLIATGMGNAEIAKRLSLSPKTVRNNVSNVFTKLQVADRPQAIVRARNAGLGLQPGHQQSE